MISKFVVRTSAAAIVAVASQAAFAQAAPAAPAAPEPAVPLTANVALTTKYKFRGQDQGNTRWFSPAVQGGFDWTAGGFYLGNWNSNVGFAGSIEMDVYGGYRGEIVKGLSYDVGLLQYLYPEKDKATNFNTLEAYGSISWEFLTLKYSHTLSKDYFGIGELQEDAGVSPRPKGRGTGYLELNANYPIGSLTLNGHIGYTRFASGLRNASYIEPGEVEQPEKGVRRYYAPGDTVDVGVPNYFDYKVGVTWDASTVMGSGVTVAAAYVGANKKGYYGDINKGRVILTLAKSF